MEIMIVLGILMLLAGIGTRGYSIYHEGKKLQNAADELKFLAKKGWQRSVGEQRDWQIVFHERVLELQVKQAVREEEQKRPKEGEEAKDRKAGDERQTYDSDLSFRIKRFGQAQWTVPKGECWIFQSSGICEPFQVQIIRQADGKEEWVELAFDPLTAGVQRMDFSD